MASEFTATVSSVGAKWVVVQGSYASGSHDTEDTATQHACNLDGMTRKTSKGKTIKPAGQ